MIKRFSCSGIEPPDGKICGGCPHKGEHKESDGCSIECPHVMRRCTPVSAGSEKLFIVLDKEGVSELLEAFLEREGGASAPGSSAVCTLVAAMRSVLKDKERKQREAEKLDPPPPRVRRATSIGTKTRGMSIRPGKSSPKEDATVALQLDEHEPVILYRENARVLIQGLKDAFELDERGEI